jgi:excisionase family DNA binding protein
MTLLKDGDNDSAREPVDAAEGRPSTTSSRSRARVLPLRDVEGAHVHYALQASNWNKREAARALGISRDTLYRKIAEHGLESPRGTRAPGRRTRSLR